MINRFLSLPLTTLLFVFLSVAAADQVVKKAPPTDAVSSDSVLQLIPEKTLGIIYCPNLLELDNRINALFTDLSARAGAPEMLAPILAGTLGANFESLADFEAIGVDVNRDFAIFITRLNPLRLSAAIHLTDTAAMKQVIESETGGSAPTEYKGVNYWQTNGDGNSFAILDNTLVFSPHPKDCESVIDTHNGAMQAITANPNFETFLADILEGTDQLGVCFDIEGITASLNGPIEEEWKSLIDNLKDNDQLSLVIESSLKNISGEQIAFVAQLQSVNAKLQVEGTDVLITPSMEFKKDSEFRNVLEEVSDELTHLGDLPERATMNAAFQGSAKLLTEISTSWLNFTPQKIQNKQEKRERLLEQVKGFYESLADQWSVSTSFGDSTLPNYLFIYELKDAQHAKNYLDEMFLEKLNYKDAYAGPSTTHNGVEIKSYIFPNPNEVFGVTPSDPFDQMPPEWHWYYAFNDGQLLFTTGTNPQLIQTALERRAGNGERFSEHPNYQELTARLGTDNNIFLTISPITAFKTMLPIIEKMDPNEAAMIQMFTGMLTNLPETYSISLAAKAQDNGIDAKLLLTLGDFKPLIQTLGMILGM